MFSVLLYGGPGAGKTYLATSAFVDHKTGDLTRNGVLITIGREGNPALSIPEDRVVRITAPPSNPSRFSKELIDALRSIVKRSRTDERYEVVVVDGFTEWGVLFTAMMSEDKGERLSEWQDMKRELIAILQMLHPEELGAYVIGTARIAEHRKGIGRSGGDPDWVDYKYFPALDGWGRRNLPHYFNFMFYLENDVHKEVQNGQVVKRRVHKVYMLEAGDFWVKNVYEHRWDGLPYVLENPTFDDILSLVEKAKGGK